jgi:hypothetical protein
MAVQGRKNGQEPQAITADRVGLRQKNAASEALHVFFAKS